MIISASRRTDIPKFYSDWFLNRIKEGYLYVRNPMNPHQISKIDLFPDAVDCIVFWTKNPEPMIARLDELSAYKYYFQFTLTSYGRDIEKNLPHKNYNPFSPLLCGTIELGDKITERKVKSLKAKQEGQYMLICDYIVIQIDGDYAHLQRTDYAEEELKLVARALLPENIAEGTKLHYEMMQYNIVE